MLELLVRQANAFEYLTCAEGWNPFPPGATVGYGGMCNVSTPSRPYMESLIMLDSFVYDATADRYRFICWLNQANWPSWKIVSYVFHPETGVMEQKIDLQGFAVAHAWTDPVYNGGLGKMYAGYLNVPPGTYGVVEVLVPDGIPTAAMRDNFFLSTAHVPILAGSNFGFAICPERKLFTVMSLMGGSYFWVYDYSTIPGTVLYQQPMPESFGWGMGYEDDQRCWMLTSAIQHGNASDKMSLMKYNFVTNKIELLSELQPTGDPDRFAQVAFDTKRKKIAAIRVKADNPTTGQANNSFEIYSPRPAMAHITVPVNLKKLSADEKTIFVSHLVGTKGEAGAAKEVSVSCAPTAALVTKPKVITEANGRIPIEILPTTPAATETITVQYDETKVTS